MAYKVLEPNEPHFTERKSSINQFDDFLAVEKGGVSIPIVFDKLDGISCNTVYSHPIALTLTPYIGYAYPVIKRRYTSDIYVLAQKYGVETKVLPSWFGPGFYQKKVNHDILVNTDGGALGVHNDYDLYVGTDYVISKKVLHGKDRED